jgi:hypothetical protein
LRAIASSPIFMPELGKAIVLVEYNGAVSMPFCPSRSLPCHD